MNKAQLHADICVQLNDTYQAKNADYGDAYSRVRKEEGDRYVLGSLKNKVYRLEALLHGENPKVKDESIEDTLLDLANYCIMEVIERKIDNPYKL
jgi:hypothetical protein